MTTRSAAPIHNVSLDTFDAQRDRERLHQWLRRRHVARWWGDPDVQLTACLARPPGGDHALIRADGIAIGYVRWQRVAREELDAAGLAEIPDGSIDIDICIGEPDYVGRGIATRALAALVERLCADPGIPLVGLGTSVANGAAIRAFEKAGFRRLREFDDPVYGRCVIMTADCGLSRRGRHGAMGGVYRRWIWANAWSELVGLGGTLSLGWIVLGGLDDASVLITIIGAGVMVAAGALLEGVVVGFAQARVLKRAVVGFATRSWILATALGAGVAWLLGMVPSTVAALSATPQEPSASGPEGAIVLVLAVGLGFVLGPILATPQYFVLKRFVRQAWIWILANALAWAAGMAVVFAGAGTIPPQPGSLQIAATLVVACLAAGAVVGGIHGLFLVRLLGRPAEDT